MTADVWAVVLVAAIAPAATVFPFWYGLVAPWYRSWIGFALMTSTTGLALLVDISLAYQWLGDDYALRDSVRLTVYSIVCAGSWLTLIAFARSRWLLRHPKR